MQILYKTLSMIRKIAQLLNPKAALFCSVFSGLYIQSWWRWTWSVILCLQEYLSGNWCPTPQWSLFSIFCLATLCTLGFNLYSSLSNSWVGSEECEMPLLSALLQLHCFYFWTGFILVLTRDVDASVICYSTCLWAVYMQCCINWTKAAIFKLI